MNKTHMIHRVSTALAEWASDTKPNGLSDWTAHDFAIDAEKFIEALTLSVTWHKSMPHKVPDEESYRTDIIQYLEWRIDPEHHAKAIDVCLFEVGPEYTDLEFDNG